MKMDKSKKGAMVVAMAAILFVVWGSVSVYADGWSPSQVEDRHRWIVEVIRYAVGGSGCVVGYIGPVGIRIDEPRIRLGIRTSVECRLEVWPGWPFRGWGLYGGGIAAKGVGEQNVKTQLCGGLYRGMVAQAESGIFSSSGRIIARHGDGRWRTICSM